MWRSSLRRELLLTARDTGARGVVLGYLGAILLFGLLPVAQAAGAPAGGRAAEILALRLTVTLRALVLVAAPWLVYRVGRREPLAALVRWCALAAVRPWRQALAKLAAGGLLLAHLPVLALPVVALAGEIQPTVRTAVGRELVELSILLAALAPAGLAWTLTRLRTLPCLAAIYLTALALAAAPALWSGAPTPAAGGVAAAFSLTALMGAVAERRLHGLDRVSPERRR